MLGLVFDFDGVIVDSENIKENVFCNVLSKHGFTVAEISDLNRESAGTSRYEKFDKLCDLNQRRKFSPVEKTMLSNEITSEYISSVTPDLALPGAVQFINSAISTGTKVYINTASESLELVQVLDIISLAIDPNNIFDSKSSKVENINKIINSHGSSELIYFGDNIIDLEAAIHHKIKFVGVGKAFDSLILNNVHIATINNFRGFTVDGIL